MKKLIKKWLKPLMEEILSEGVDCKIRCLECTAYIDEIPKNAHLQENKTCRTCQEKDIKVCGGCFYRNR